jgi:tetrahydromethanopterin S-methyltransferase subunit B
MSPLACIPSVVQVVGLSMFFGFLVGVLITCLLASAKES